MTDTDKIVAAIFAAGMCNKVSATPEDYLQKYYEILEKMQKHESEKRTPTVISPKMVEEIKRSAPPKRR